MAKPQFTFKNYLKEVKKCRIFVAILVILGLAGGAFYSFAKPATYQATSKVSVYNSSVNDGPVTSPYAQISELLMSKELVSGDLAEYEVTEAPFGVFEIVATSTDSKKAVDTANTVMDNTGHVITIAFEDAGDYRTTVLDRAADATLVTSTKKRILSTAIITAVAFVFALIVVFVKFDYIAEK